MAEVLGTVAAIVQIVATCMNACQTTASLIDRIRTAPKHVVAISNDSRAFYGVLSTIQAYLDDDEVRDQVLHPAILGDIQLVLKNCIAIFQDLCRIVNDYSRVFDGNEPNMSAWHRTKWSWRQTEITHLREQLNTHKITLSVAIAATNLVNTTKTEVSTRRIEKDVQDLKSALTILLKRLDEAEEQKGEVSIILYNYEHTLRRVAHDAASILSSIHGSAAPSLSMNFERIISTVGSRSTFETAPLVATNANARLYIDGVLPDLEYTGTFFHVSVYLHGSGEHVEQLRGHFRQVAGGISTTDLSVLCRKIFAGLEAQGSPGARMDFYFYETSHNLTQMSKFLSSHMTLTLPRNYQPGDYASISPWWMFTLFSLRFDSEGPNKRWFLSTNASVRWRMTFSRLAANPSSHALSTMSGPQLVFKSGVRFGWDEVSPLDDSDFQQSSRKQLQQEYNQLFRHNQLPADEAESEAESETAQLRAQREV